MYFDKYSIINSFKCNLVSDIIKFMTSEPPVLKLLYGFRLLWT